jgi:hypothetical protein
MTEPAERWAAGDAYEPYVGRWSRLVAGEFLAWLAVDGRMDAVVSGLVLNFVLDPGQAVREMVRVAGMDGRVAAYVWDYAGRMELIRCFWEAAVEMDPAAVELDEGRRFGLCRPEPLTRLFQDAGLVEVRTRSIDVATRFGDFADYWTPFLGGQGPAPGYAMSLGAEQRTALREELRARLPVAPDGSISLVARAWAVQGARGR